MAVSDPRIMEHMFSEIGLVGEERTQQQGSNPLQVGLKELIGWASNVLSLY